ncbi:MAG: hypothetical protein CL608_34295 [Anaerolineaceae bacterium]|jgi:hypothetical protein|nr:hypothetical protein [Anaerolineaceae bacterium]
MCMSSPSYKAPDIPAPQIPAPPPVKPAPPLAKPKAMGVFMDAMRRRGKSAMTIQRNTVGTNTP